MSRVIVQWGRVATGLMVVSAVTTLALGVPVIGMIWAGFLVLLMASLALRLGWSSSPSMGEVIALVDRELGGRVAVPAPAPATPWISRATRR